MHMDGGTNLSVTNDERLLHEIKSIPPYSIQGAQSGPADIICTKKDIYAFSVKDEVLLKKKCIIPPILLKPLYHQGI